MKEEEVQKVIEYVKKKGIKINSDACLHIRNWEIEYLEEDYVFVLLSIHSSTKKTSFFGRSFIVDHVAYFQTISPIQPVITIDVLLMKRILQDAFKMEISVFNEKRELIRKIPDMLMEFNN